VRPRIYLSAPSSLLQRGSSGSRQPSLAAMGKTIKRQTKKGAVKGDWLPDWKPRLDAIVRHGLPTLIKGASIVDGFASIELEVDEAILPRTHTMRGFGLHITLGYETDYGEQVLRDAINRINSRWADEWIPLRIERYGSGGSVELAWDDMLLNDSDIYWLHSRGWYGNGVNCLPRKLHVSL
jgi:hypothetical protein